MGKIKQLSHHEAQKIAAGEVVERPANIVKELIENSIDAGATRITLYIEDAGKKLIRIIDNGCGMDSADAKICFDRHATSKITHVEELESINTFGFRGEALASIAAVSQITLITKQKDTLEGTHLVIEANNIISIDSVACTTGTDIRIHNLFFNVPARKKFLKTSQTEWRAIQLLFNAFCFDYPHIHFLLFTEDKQVLNCPNVANTKDRALQLWENSTHHNLLTIDANDNIVINGIISNHQHYRYDRSNIYFFVNKRWVKNHQLGNALLKGYDNVIPQGRYPIGAITITVPSHEVDINIHPRKEEVKFLHPRKVEIALQNAVKKALEAHTTHNIKKNTESAYSQPPRIDNFKPFDFDNFFNKPFSANQEQITSSRIEQQSFNSAAEHNSIATVPNTSATQLPTEALTLNKDKTISLSTINDLPHEEQLPLSEVKTSNVEESYRIIGQYKTTYILIEKDDGLFLVDQHAAHERILYELFSERFHEVATIQLLFPHIVTLSVQDITVLIPYLDIFSNNGIIIEQYAHNQLIIQSLPVHLKELSLDDIIKEFIGWIIEHQSIPHDELKKTINNKLQAQMACKAAVKAGDTLTHEKMKQLLSDLEKTTNRFSCPHGRPTGWLLSLSDIEKKFKRRS